MDSGELPVTNERHESGSKNVVLKSVLVVLVISILGLSAGVIGMMVAGDKVENTCLDKSDTYEIAKCIDGIYTGDGKDKAITLYDEAVNRAYDSGNNSDYYNLLIARSLLLAANDDCVRAVELLNDSRVDELPIADEKAVYYSRSLGIADSCGRAKSADEFANKLMEVNASGEIEGESF